MSNGRAQPDLVTGAVICKRSVQQHENIVTTCHILSFNLTLAVLQLYFHFLFCFTFTLSGAVTDFHSILCLNHLQPV